MTLAVIRLAKLYPVDWGTWVINSDSMGYGLSRTIRVDVRPHPMAAVATNADGGNSFEKMVAGIWHRIFLKVRKVFRVIVIRRRDIHKWNRNPTLASRKGHRSYHHQERLQAALVVARSLCLTDRELVIGFKDLVSYYRITRETNMQTSRVGRLMAISVCRVSVRAPFPPMNSQKIRHPSVVLNHHRQQLGLAFRWAFPSARVQRTWRGGKGEANNGCPHVLLNLRGLSFGRST